MMGLLVKSHNFAAKFGRVKLTKKPKYPKSDKAVLDHRRCFENFKETHGKRKSGEIDEK